MSLINVSNLSFAYEGSYDTIFENVSFQIDTNWKLGLVGRNGRGKTTFLNLLTGRYPFKGTISANVGFDYFPFTPPQPDRQTIQILRQLCPTGEDWQFICELSRMEIDGDALYRPFSILSNGEQTKVMLAALFLKENRFLLIDEPTNHLDGKGRSLVSRYLRSKKGFILVSHDRAFLDGCVDHILSINRTDIQLQKGNFSSWYQNKQLRDKFEQAENQKLQRDIKRLSTAAAQAHQWADKVESTKIGKKSLIHEKNIGTRAYIGEKSRRMQQRRKNLERRQQSALDEKQRLLKNVETAPELKIHPLPYFTDKLLSLKNVSVAYGEKKVFTGITLDIRLGERVAVLGGNGCGKSTLLKLVLGGDIPYTGTRQTGSGLSISYLPQDTSFLKGSLSGYSASQNIDESLFKAILRKLDFSRQQFEKDMAGFSAGQKKKVLLAASLCQQSHLYVWDEPLNYIDIFSRMQLQQLLQQYQPTLLFVEHDLSFVENVATRKIYL